MEFVDTTSRNLIDPGASFTQGLGMGVNAALTLRQQAQTKQLAMAQLGEQGREFDAMQVIRQQSLDLDRQRTMADIGLIGAQQKLAGVQIQQQQFTADQLPKQAANNAYIQQLLADPKSHDFNSGPDWLSQQLGKAPYPEAINPVEADATVSAVRTRNAMTALGLAKQNQLTTNLGIMTDAYHLGFDVDQFRKNPQAPATPDNVNIPLLAQQVISKGMAIDQNKKTFDAALKMQEIEAQGKQRLDYVNALVNGRQSTGWERTMAQSYATATKKVTDLMRAGSAANSPEVQQAQAEAAKWGSIIDAYRQSTGQSPAQGNMQNPSGTAPDTTSTPNPNVISPSQVWSQSIGK